MTKATPATNTRNMSLRTAKVLLAPMLNVYLTAVEVAAFAPDIHISNVRRYLLILEVEGFVVWRERTRAESAAMGVRHRYTRLYTVHKFWGGMAHDSD